MSVNLRQAPIEKRQLSILSRENPDLQKLLAVYPEEEAAKLLNNKEKLDKITKAFSSISTAHSAASMIMTCHDNCPYKDICILKKEGVAPYGHQCVIERQIAAQLEYDVVEYLKIETSNPIEMELLWDLIDMKLLDMRASADLKDGKLLQKIETSVGKITQTKEEINQLLEAKLELKKVKHSIIDSFVATRRARKKYGTNSDVSSLEQAILKAAQISKEDDQ